MSGSSPCADCTLGCCRDYLVTITGYDMWTIARGLNMAPEQFVVVVQQKEPSERGFLLDRSGQTYEIALDKRPAETEYKPCVFFLEMPSGVGRCGIYAMRPYVCQTYPTFLQGNGEVERRGDVLCPEDAWREGILKRPVWRERLLRMHIEFQIYALAVARWNYHVLYTPKPELFSFLGYLTFLMSFYGRLEPVRESIAGGEWLEMCERWCECMLQSGSPLEADLPEMVQWSSVTNEIRDVANSFFPDDLGLSDQLAHAVSQPRVAAG